MDSFFSRDSWTKAINSKESSQTVATNSKELSLDVLPVEILQHIDASYLPLDAAASLSLCNHSMLNILGDHALRSLRLKTYAIERRRFLKNLQNDFPDWLFCHHCSMLHPVNQNRDPRQLWPWSAETHCSRLDGVVSVRFLYRIRYEHAQTIMRDYWLGRDYETNLKKLCTKETLDLPDSFHEEVITATIVRGELRLDINHTLRLLQDWNVYMIPERIGPLCPHLKNYFDASILGQALRCSLIHADEFPCVNCSKKKGCSECSTTFTLKIRRLEGSATEVKVDIWRDLGSCKSPFDLKWRKQTAQFMSRARERQYREYTLQRLGRVFDIDSLTNVELSTWCANLR